MATYILPVVVCAVIAVALVIVTRVLMVRRESRGVIAGAAVLTVRGTRGIRVSPALHRSHASLRCFARGCRSGRSAPSRHSPSLQS